MEELNFGPTKGNALLVGLGPESDETLLLSLGWELVVEQELGMTKWMGQVVFVGQAEGVEEGMGQQFEVF